VFGSQWFAQPENGYGPPDDPLLGPDCVHVQVASGQEHETLYDVPSLHDSKACRVHDPGPPLPPPPMVCLHTGPTPASMPMTVEPHSGGSDGLPVHGTHVRLLHAGEGPSGQPQNPGCTAET
jgi:hypothetical protein